MQFFNKIQTLFNRWQNLGFEDEDLSRFNEKLARENLLVLPTYIFVCIALFSALFLSRSIVAQSFSLFVLVPFVLTIMSLLLVYVLAKEPIRKSHSCFNRSLGLTIAFCFIVILLCILYDNIIQYETHYVMICISLTALPLLFVVSPKVTTSSVLLVLAFVTALELVRPNDLMATNIVNMWISGLFGIFLSWNKTRNRYASLIESDRASLALERGLKAQIVAGQIRPHFVCNVLSAIHALCDIDTKKAQQITDKLADYMRSGAEASSEDGPIPFSRELDHIRNYVSIETLRFGEELKVRFNISSTDFSLPALSVQPLVINAIKHARGNLQEDAVVAISSYADSKAYYVMVEDNGLGTSIEALDDIPYDNDNQNLGNLFVIRERIRKIMGGELEFHSSIEEGAVALITIPKAVSKEFS